MAGKLPSRLHLTLVRVPLHRWMWLESMVITLCALALGLFFKRDDPFQLGGEFPWILFAPVLLALRYGVAPGIFSSLILLLAWLLLDNPATNKAGFPREYFLGCLILVMLCGEFSEAWGIRLHRLEETNRHLGERLRRITHRHLLLRLSHDRMGQEILTKPVTLRDALVGLRQLTSGRNDSHLSASLSLLQLLTKYCQLESAAIFVLSPDDGVYKRISEIGTPPDLPASDPLLLHALEHQSLSHLLTDGLADTALPSPFLVVAPIHAGDAHLLGVLAIDSMPFLALNEENLQMLSVMLGYYADCVVEADGTRQFFKHCPDAPTEFAAEFSRLLRLQRDYDIDSHVIVHSFGNDENGRQAVTQHARIRRGLDILWQKEIGGRMVLANLMPLSNRMAVKEYLLRIETTLKEYMGGGYDEKSLAPIVISLAESDPLATLIQVTNGIST